MADYSTAASNAEESLNAQTDGGVEEYQIGNRRVRRSSAEAAVKSAALIEGLAARRAGKPISALAKLRDAR